MLFAGSDDVPMYEIGKRAGVGQATLYRNFPDRSAIVAASDDTISAMDADQYATGEGPCVDASVQGRWFHADSLAAETRWPAFTPQARSLGINAILSSPLLARERPVGALNIYSRRTGAFSPQDQRLAAVFAAEASVILSEEGVDLASAPPPQRPGKAQSSGAPRSQPATDQTTTMADAAICRRKKSDSGASSKPV